MSPGTANIQAKWTAVIWDIGLDGSGCSKFFVNPSPFGRCDVVIPKSLRFLHFPPRAPNGIGQLITVTDGQVLGTGGNVLKEHQCGAYRNLAYEVVDQNGDPFDFPFTITESFDNYSGVDKVPEPFEQAISNNAIGDTMHLGRTAPACLGPDDHESFQQHAVVTYKNIMYPLTTVVSVSRGRFSGDYKVDVSITKP